MEKGLRTKNLKFFTGMENYEESNAVPEDKFYFAQNARFAGKVLSSKNGFQALGDLLVGGTKFQGTYEYNYFDGTTEYNKLIGFYNRSFYEFNEATQVWDIISTVWPNIQDSYADGVVYGNALYVVGDTNKNGNGVGKVFSGIDFVFTVAGIVTTPSINAVYQNAAGSQFVVIATNIVAGAGTVTMKRQITVTDPAAAGTLDLAGGGTGDATLTYSSFTKASSITTSFTVIDGSSEGIGIEAYLERLVVIGDPSFTGMILMSQPSTSPADHYKVENFDTTTGATYFTAAKNTFLKAVRVLNDSIYYWSLYSLFQHTRQDIIDGNNPKEISRTGGAVNQKSTFVIENDVWFITASNEIRSLGTERNLGTDPRTKALSEIIKRSMNLLEAEQDNPVMIYNKRVVKLNLKTKGSPTNNFTIIFDYNTGGFSIDRGQAVNVNVVWKGYIVYGEDSTGQAFLDDTGFTFNGAEFAFQAYTPFMDDGRPDTFKRARYIYFRGQFSYQQGATLRLYRDGKYSVYSDYPLPSPEASGVPLASAINDGEWGQAQFGEAPWGGTPTDTGEEIAMYRIEKLISVDRRSNLFAIGILADIDAGKVVTEQLLLKLIDENENYKRADI